MGEIVVFGSTRYYRVSQNIEAYEIKKVSFLQGYFSAMPYPGLTPRAILFRPFGADSFAVSLSFAELNSCAII
jgi:hypothetical protein